MANGKFQYIIELRDRVSSQLAAVNKVMQTSLKGFDTAKKKTQDLGGSMGELRHRIELLRTQKELIHPDNIRDIGRINNQIDVLSGKLDKLDNAGRSGLKKYFGELKNSVFGVALNPIAIGTAAVGFSAKSAMSFEEGISKINITAQLDPEAKKNLAGEITKIAKKYSFDLAVAPDGFEKIISQTGNVDSSLNILDAAIKATRAGFVDLDTVSAAAAQTVSITGADANDVLDAFFASKRVGAGEFVDFANYMPGLIASADTLGMKYRDVAGVFAYMTGKGQSAERASVLMGNMLSMLQRTDVTDKLKANGITVFDEAGKMRDIVDIFKDLKTVMAPMSDEQSSAFMQGIGITDKEAKSAFAIMKSDTDKLAASMNEVRNSTGEMDKALALAKNPMRDLNDVIADFKNIGTDLGIVVMPVITTGLQGLGFVVNIAARAIKTITDFIGGWIGEIKNGNPVIIGLTALIAALTIAMNGHAIVAGTVRVATTLWTKAQWLLNAAMTANPIGLVIVGIVALIAIIIVCVKKVQGWGDQWESIMNFMKLSWRTFVASFKAYWNTVYQSFMIGLNYIQIGWYKFKESLGLGDSGFNKKMLGELSKEVEGRKKVIAEGYKEVASLARQTKDSLQWKLSLKKDGKGVLETKDEIMAAIAPTSPAASTTGDVEELQEKTTPKTKGIGRQTSSVIDLNKISDLKGSTAYNAIAAKLTPVVMSPTSASSTMAMPSDGSVVPTMPQSSPEMPSTLSQSGTSSVKGRTMLQKICDTIEIHIANADGKGYDRIREEVTKALLDIVVDYA